ncbi:hypothetical protein [Roseibium sp. MMSF_3544]|uniref:COG3904 family protein n=1 Tax=unclassified Roseibium TaxID=2629323 RepID=UPI002740139A|nr:hypothetical protein [Roseibium sp. MMSF_3544]
MLVRFLIVLSLAFVILNAEQDAVFADMSFERVTTESGTRLLVIRGRFDFGDDLSAFTSAVADSRPEVITFDSTGGNPSTAMSYGRRIRAFGLNTVQVRDFDCMSACALAFFGGVSRFAEPGSIGVHQTYFEPGTDLSGADAVAMIQSHTAEVIAYLTEMGVSPELLQLSLSVESDDIRFLTGKEMARYQVTNLQAQAKAPSIFNAPARRFATPQPQTKPQFPRATTPSDYRAMGRDFIVAYQDAWSGDNLTAMRFMEGAYSNSVTFYGNDISIAEVLEEKRRFTMRWPSRYYEIKQDTLSINCNRVCRINAVVVWFAQSRPRSAKSSGEATIEVYWDPHTGRITSETGKVISIDRRSGNPTHLIELWHSENELCRGSSSQTGPGGACDRRERVSAKLARANWCYGRKGEYGYQHEWHTCNAGSLR